MLEYIKKLLHISEKKIEVKATKDHINESLIKILSKSEIWSWSYGIVYKAKVKIWDKIRNFAIKSFQKPSKDREYNFTPEIQHCLDTHKLLKEHNIPTWNTYRELKWENSILMTLWGHKEWEILFSANNNSKDINNLIQNRIKLGTEELNKFFEKAINIITNVSKINMMIFFDSFIFSYYKGDLDIIIGDLDRVEIDKYPSTIEAIVDVNIRRFWTCLSRLKPYFDLDGTNISEAFYNYIVNLQKQNHPIVSNFNWLPRMDK